MNEKQRKILKMVSEGKVGVEEAEQLFEAMGMPSRPEPQVSSSVHTSEDSRALPKYIRIIIKGDGEHGREKLNIRVPFQILQAGINLGSMMPEEAKQQVREQLRRHNINIDPFSLKNGELDLLIQALKDIKIDITDRNESVHIFCE